MPSLGDIRGLRDGLQVVIQLNNNGQAVGVDSEKLARFGAFLVKKWGLCPMGNLDWRTVPDEQTDPMWEIMRVRYIFVSIFKIFHADHVVLTLV